MSTTLLYALIMAISQIVVTLISYFLGYQTDHIASGRWFGFMPLLLQIVVLIFGIKAVREDQSAKGLTYGQGVGTGALITLYSCIIGSIYAYIHFTYVNPNFADSLIEASRAEWAAKGMPGAQMENVEKGMRWFTKPGVQAVAGFLIGGVSGIIISLIASAFLKREPVGGAPVTA